MSIETSGGTIQHIVYKLFQQHVSYQNCFEQNTCNTNCLHYDANDVTIAAYNVVETCCIDFSGAKSLICTVYTLVRF